MNLAAETCLRGMNIAWASKTGSGVRTEPHKGLKRVDEKRVKRERKAIQIFSSESLPVGVQMTPLTTVESLTPLSVMALRDGRGFADLPEKLKARRIFS